MKEEELREKCTCFKCGEKIGSSMSIMFTTVLVKTFVVDIEAVKRQSGLAMMMGGGGMLAQVMGPNEDMAKEASSKEVTVCQSCLHLVNLPEIIEEN